MSVKRMIENEISLEKKILKRYRNADKTGASYLVCKESGGRKRFYFRNRRTGKLTYINRNKMQMAEDLMNKMINYRTREILESNIAELNDVLDRVQDYDNMAVLGSLPSAYRKFSEIISHGTDVDDHKSFPQSENPKDRDGLKFRTSFDLMVRSKNEMIIAEDLYNFNQKFWYERGLEIIVKTGDSYNSEIIYPDFTIGLVDGSLVYWEHFGMMDDPEYRDKNYVRIQKYLANGIYPPKNLILTFDGEDMPFDNNGVIRIIERDLIR